MRAIGEADRCRAARDFFHRNAVRQIAEPSAPVLIIHGDAEYAKLAELRPQIARKLVVAVDLVSARRDLLMREARDRIAQRIHVLAEREVEPPPSIRDHRRSLPLYLATIDGGTRFVRLTSN